MDFKTFSEKYNLEVVLKQLTSKYVNQFLQEHPDAKITAFGSDCEASSMRFFLSILTSEGVKNMEENWLTSWGWISEWDFWDFNEAFENEEEFEKLQLAYETITFGFFDDFSEDEAAKKSEEMTESLMKMLITVLAGVKASHPRLKEAHFIVLDHGDMQEESETRLKSVAL